MTEDVVIKSYSHGLTLVMNDKVPIEQLLISICKKFAGARKFFGEADMALALEGRTLSLAETEAVIQAIERNSGIHVNVVVTKDRMFEKEMTRKKDAFFFRKAADYLKLHTGNVASGDKVISSYGLLVTGDIESGGTCECAGSLVVLGTIKGSAHAGRETGSRSYIIAGGVEEADIAIGSVRETFGIRKKKRLLSSKNEMIMITVKDGELSPAQFSGSIDV